jgi:hypothetical protein
MGLVGDNIVDLHRLRKGRIGSVKLVWRTENLILALKIHRRRVPEKSIELMNVTATRRMTAARRAKIIKTIS